MTDWNAVKDALIGSLEDRASAFLKANQPVAELLRERAKLLVGLAADWELAKPEDKPRIERSLAMVQRAIVNEIDAAALNASVDAKKWFGDMAHTAFGLTIKLIRKLVFKL